MTHYIIELLLFILICFVASYAKDQKGEIDFLKEKFIELLDYLKSLSKKD